MAARLVVLASGEGSLLQALLDAAAEPDFGASVVAVGADRAGIKALDRAAAVGVPTFVVGLADHPDRPAWDQALTSAVAAYRPDLVVSAGFMKIFGERFLDTFRQRCLNTHPALLPAFPGAHGVADALEYGVKVTGATVHLVDEGVDTGPIIAQEAVPVEPDDDVASLHERIKTVERALLVQTVGRMVSEGWTVRGRKVLIP